MPVELEDYISKLHSSLICLISNGTVKMKLVILAFLHCEDFVQRAGRYFEAH